MKEVFTWCQKCVFYVQCYRWDEDGEVIGGPDFLEPACGAGPAKKEPRDERTRFPRSRAK